jgi:hypothetical protein
LLEEIGRFRIVAVFSGLTEQTFDFSTVPCVTTIEERDSKMILSFLATVLGGVVGPDGTSIGPDGGGRIPGESLSRTEDSNRPQAMHLRPWGQPYVSTIERLAGSCPVRGM